MPRIPDATALGDPRIPVGRAPEVIDNTASMAAEGAIRTTAEVNDAVQQYARGRDEFDLGRAQALLTAADRDARDKLEDAPDFQAFDSRYTDAMSKGREAALKLVGGPRARAYFEQQADAAIGRGRESVHALAKQKEGDWGRAELSDTLESNYRSALTADNTAAQQAIAKSVSTTLSGAVQSGYIDHEQAGNLGRGWMKRYAEGYVETVPEEQRLGVLKKPDGTPAEHLDPARRAELIERLEDKLKIKADHAEAIAERAQAQAERQIASGVPATPAMWAKWRQLVHGTTVEGDFNELVAGEKEVQDTLRKPIAEQIRLVQQKDADLKASGGTVAQAANIERLRGAVKQNVALIENAPLLFAEQRMEQPTTPIEANDWLDPTKRADVAANITDRTARLAAVSKRYGAQVGMKPLLPQEAAEMSSLLEQASPKEASSLFSSLRDAAQDPAVFKGMMAQIAPDSPVASAAGLLAAKRADLVTGKAFWWFNPDTSITSTDAAATIMHGERILHPSKTAKSEDGRPQSSKLLLSEAAQVDLQTKFADAVGKAYKGRDGAANIDFQTVLAYYAGRASEKGKLSPDSKTADPGIVREAVKAVLGNVTDFHNNGEVFPPWGMTQDEFEDRAESALTRTGASLGLGDDFAGKHAVGLTNTDQEGVYAVTIGGILPPNPKDPHGDPITIDLRTPDERARRGYINRSGR